MTEVSGEVMAGAASDVYAFDVVCRKLGETKFDFTVGNQKSATNPYVSACIPPCNVIIS